MAIAISNSMFFLLLTAITFTAVSHAAIVEEKITNVKSQVIGQVAAPSRIQLFNLHRTSNPPLKMSLHGAIVDRVEKKSDTLWSLVLNDTTSVDISVISESANLTNYYLL